MPEFKTLDEIFISIDKKLSLNAAKTITEEEISEVYNYYLKEKIRFNQDQSQFIKPGKKAASASTSTQAILQRIKDNPLKF